MAQHGARPGASASTASVARSNIVRLTDYPRTRVNFNFNFNFNFQWPMADDVAPGRCRAIRGPAVPLAR
eukprot:1944249-Prymnesium_polylepis.1